MSSISPSSVYDASINSDDIYTNSDNQFIHELASNCFDESPSLFGRVKNIVSGIYDSVCNSSALIQMSFTVAVLGLSFFPTYQTQRADDKDTAYAIARGAGSALKHLLPFIFLPTLRMLHAKVHQYFPRLVNTQLIEKLFHNRMSFHKYLGEAFLISAAVHTAAHTYRRSVPLSAQESVTGITMLAMTTLPIAFMYAMRSSRVPLANWAFDKSYYSQFLIPHQLGWWGLVGAYAVHTRDYRLFSWALGFSGLFCVDRIWEWIESSNVTVKNIDKIHDTMMILEIEKPESFEYKAGQKAYLAYPPSTAFVNNLHPFTISSSPEENVVRFVISINSEWTRYLIDRLSEGDIVRLSPAFPSPLHSIESEAKRLLITSGSGIATTLAHIHNREDDSEISIIHTSRNREEFELLSKYVLDERFNVSSVEYYDTSTSYNSKLRSRNKPRRATIISSRFTPDGHHILNNFEGRVYYCGNEVLGDAVENQISPGKRKTFYREKFNF